MAAEEPNEKSTDSKDKPSIPTWIQAACAVALVGITFFYTYYAKQQVEEMRKATLSAKQGADAAASAAYTAAAALQASDNQFKTTVRPYVVKEAMTLLSVPVAGSKVKTKLVMKNCGRTPALNIKLWGKVALSSTEPKQREDEWRRKASKMPDHMGEAGSDMPRATYVESDAPISEQQVEKINKSSLRVYVYGSIVYEDIFKNVHATDFCGHYRPEETGRHLWTCDQGNNVD